MAVTFATRAGCLLPGPPAAHLHLHPRQPPPGARSCGNVAAILELGDGGQKAFKVFEAAPQEARGVPGKKAAPDYFL